MQQVWDKNGNVYFVDEQGQKVNNSLGNWQKAINKGRAAVANIENWINETNPNSDAYKQKVSLISALTTAPAGMGSFATNALAKVFTPFMSRKIAQAAAQGFGGGLVGGAVESGVDSALNGENIALGALKGAAIGAPLGLAGGYAIGKMGQGIVRTGLKNGTTNKEQYFNDYVADLNNKSKAMQDFRLAQTGGNKGASYGLDDSLNPKHQAQMKIIENTNPAPNTYQTWIRNADDIYDFEDTLKMSDWADYWQDGLNPDYTGDTINKALQDGKITIYSSHPISTGEFVTPSKMEAMSYSGNGKVYQKEVPLDDVAWIDPTQGQYAPPNLAKFYENPELEPLKYTGDYVKLKGENYPEIFLPPDEYASKFSDTNSYVWQNHLENYKDIIKRYYPGYNIDVVMEKGMPRIINKGK